MFVNMMGNLALLFRAVGCIFGELLNNSPLFPVSVIFFRVFFILANFYQLLTHFCFRVKMTLNNYVAFCVY